MFIILLASTSLSLFLLLLPYHAIHADTAVDSEITQNTTWTKANSPYVVSGNPTVDAGATLTIDAGVTVKFNNSSMTVFGNIMAQGTAQNKITFISASGTAGSPVFSGLDFISASATSSLSYVSVKDVSTEFFAYNSALDIENSTFDSGKGLSASGSSLYLNTVSFSCSLYTFDNLIDFRVTASTYFFKEFTFSLFRTSSRIFISFPPNFFLQKIDP